MRTSLGRIGNIPIYPSENFDPYSDYKYRLQVLALIITIGGVWVSKIATRLIAITCPLSEYTFLELAIIKQYIYNYPLNYRNSGYNSYLHPKKQYTFQKAVVSLC
jgi:hypothetical protein